MSSTAVLTSPRDRILKVAWKLFYEHSFRAIGIDRIIAEAGVAKQSFYNHFRSKDELIVALLDQAAHYSMQWEAEAISGRPDPLVAIVEAAIRRASEDSCFGCTFQVGASEFPDPSDVVHQAARRAKDATLDRYKAYALQEKLADADRAARDIFLLMEGIWIAVRLFGRDAPVCHVA
ncbi:TetR/AcrR family transcriptional regulator, partial [Tabrizicola sp.]|uniref:TetR/AcrR family transcriptional regulator n=1 Tax=Tabrizicola sp. TaxID=2005166 RepID=UPI003F405D2B